MGEGGPSLTLPARLPAVVDETSQKHRRRGRNGADAESGGPRDL